MPRLSFALPVYNGARYLQRTLDDLLGQTFGDLEIVASDNASTDATPDILSAYARRDPRLVVVRNAENVGALANANLATARCRAPLVALAAYDDRHAPTFAAALVGALDADPSAVLAYSRSTLIGEDEKPFRFCPDARAWADAGGNRYDYDAALEQPLPHERVARFRAVLRSTDVNSPIHGVFRREALDRIGGHHVHGSDRLIVAHAALLGPFAFVDAPLFGYRIHGASTVFLTREAWLERESGGTTRGSVLDGWHTLVRYARASGRADLSRLDRARALAAVAGYAARPTVLRNTFLPGPNNYFGWRRAPLGLDVGPSPMEPADPSAPLGPWAWLDDPGAPNRHSRRERSGMRRDEVQSVVNA